ncbi:MAG: glycosyl hydrolase family 8 [Fibromonadales bacterium]|nr:glycosyl hydrolase family 8 [Fibromonadales bacterium]
MKNNTFFILCCSVLLLVAVSYSQTVNYPYPMRKNYGNGTINTTNSMASQNLKAKFGNFMTQFYAEGTCSNKRNGTCARIKFDNLDETVSEGIGYGMLLMVYFSEKSPGKSYQSEFDKLWVYYQNWTNNNGLMNWKIKHNTTGNNFTGGSVTGENSATDAEYDVALALIMAHYQFGNTSTKNYLDTAKALISKIWSLEHNTSTGLHKPGDLWDADKNPSYVAPAAYELFKDLDNATNWTLALSANYSFLIANQNKTTGLPSGWANADGSVKSCSNCGYSPSNNYNQDAVRAPWRWAKANAWFGHSNAKTLLGILAPWVNGKNASDVAGPIALQTGAWGNEANSSYVGSLACALTYGSTYQAKLNEYWNVLNGKESEPYYNQAMRLLTGLLITGNMPNLKACGTNCGTDMGGGTPGTGTSMDKLSMAGSEELDDRALARTFEPWYAYTDVNDKGKATITNESFKTQDEHSVPPCKEITSYRVVMEDVTGGGDWVVKIPSYTLNKGCPSTCSGSACPSDCNPYASYVALGLNARNNGKTYNLSQCTDGFSYEYKGQSHNFKMQTTDIPSDEGSDFFTNIGTVATAWTPVTVAFTDVAQPTWATTKITTFDPNKIYGFIWELKGSDNGGATGAVSATTGNLAIKNFRCLGTLTLPNDRPPVVCNDGGGTRVNMSLFANSNALIAMQNSLNLQVASNATVKIFDLRGNTVRSLNVAKGSHVVSLSDLPRGMYIVKASNASWNRTITIPVK